MGGTVTSTESYSRHTFHEWSSLTQEGEEGKGGLTDEEMRKEEDKRRRGREEKEEKVG